MPRRSSTTSAPRSTALRTTTTTGWTTTTTGRHTSLDRPGPGASPRRCPGPHAGTSPTPPHPGSHPTPACPAPSLRAHLRHAPHEALPHLLITGALYGSQVPRHLAIFILLELEHLPAGRLIGVHQFPHTVTVRGDARLHLIIQRHAALHLLAHEGAALPAELLLAGAQLGGLVGRQL